MRYPQWYINYTQGFKGMPLPVSAKKVLTYLSDEAWHRNMNCGASVGSIEACVELGLIENRFYKKTERGHMAEFKITPKGKETLEKKVLS